MINQRKLMIKQNIACEHEPNAQSLIYTLTHTKKKWWHTTLLHTKFSGLTTLLH